MDAAAFRVPAAVVVSLAIGAFWGAVAPASASAAGLLPVQVGIADQKQEAFTDPRLRALKLGFARRSVAWDAMRYGYQVKEIQAWIDATHQAGMEPLITFARSRSPKRRHKPPTPTEYRRQFRRFKTRFRQVRTYSAWNEANHCGTATCHRPRLAAQYYKILRRNCVGCTVLAADLNDHPDPVPWVREFIRALGYEPKIWGYHNYIDANFMRTKLTRRLMRAIKGEVWLTEVGGLVARRNGSTQKMPQGKAHAAKVTRFIFDRLVRVSPRITRVYLYHWSAATKTDSWDSAFIAPNGTPRPSLPVLEEILNAGTPPAN
jgi:Glycosyl hydrolase catalytic core